MQPNTSTNTNMDADLGKLLYLPNMADVLPATQSEDNITSTFDPTNNWLGSLMEKKDYKELNAFFDLNYNHIISKGLSYCGIIEKNDEWQKAGKSMNESKLLELYISKVDKDQGDLRSDIRASEQRTSEKISSIESRMDERLNRIEDLILRSNENTDRKISIIENKIDTTDKNIDAKLEVFRTDLREHKFFKITMAIGIIGVCLATIIGMATMV